MCDFHNERFLREIRLSGVNVSACGVVYCLRFVAVFFLILSLSGCSSEVFRHIFRARGPQGITGVNLSRFERTSEKIKVSLPGDKPVTVRFEGVSFPIGMRSLTDISGIPIVWDSSLDNEFLSGTFVNQPLFVVLSSVCQRSKVSLSEFGGGFYLGEFKEGSLASAVVRIPPIDREELIGTLDSFKTENGSCTMVGSFIWIRNTFENVQHIINDLDVLRTKSERSYIAEVFFIRVNEDDFVNLTADLRFNAVDIFSSSFNVEQLFSMFVNADCELVDGVVVLADEGTDGDLVNGLTPIDVPVYKSGAQDTVGLLENVLGQFAAESCIFIGADWPFIDPVLIDQLVRTAYMNSKCDYAAYQFTNEVFSAGRPYGLFPEWYCSSTIMKAAEKLDDAVYRSLPGSFFLDHQKEYCVELLLAPTDLDQGGMKFSFEDEEDWDNIIELHEALSLEVLDCRKIGGILERRMQRELTH